MGMENHRRYVQGIYPAAKLRTVKDYPRIGDRSYRIIDGDRPIGWPEGDPTTAWREAERVIADVPSRAILAMGQPMTDDAYKAAVDAWIAAKSDWKAT